MPGQLCDVARPLRRRCERRRCGADGGLAEVVEHEGDVGERGGQARLDYTQNAVNKTLVAPYSPRASAGAPVSAPISWDELDADWLRPDAFTVRTVLDRVAEHGDLFRGVLDSDQVLPMLR